MSQQLEIDTSLKYEPIQRDISVGYLGDNIDLDINSTIYYWQITPRHIYVSQRTEKMYEGEGWLISIARIVWTFEVTYIIATRLLNSLVNNGKKSCFWQEKTGVIWNTAYQEKNYIKHFWITKNI